MRKLAIAIIATWFIIQPTGGAYKPMTFQFKTQGQCQTALGRLNFGFGYRCEQIDVATS